MGVPIILIGKSGTGKSTSMRSMPEGSFGLINVIGKPLPFRGRINQLVSTDYNEIRHALDGASAKSIVIDDAGYLITDMFMTRHSSVGQGNAVFALYNDIGDSFYNLIRFVTQALPQDTIVYFVMHEDTDDYGRAKIKTLGRLLDEKVTLEGMVSIVLRSDNSDGRYTFQTNGEGICKSPEGMFDDELIPNDLKMVDDAVRDYWGMAPLASTKAQAKSTEPQATTAKAEQTDND